MDIIKSRREERQKRTSILKTTIQKAFDTGLSIDQEKLIAEACIDWGTSRRYVQELITNLKFSMPFTIENKQIIPPEDKKE